MSVLSFNCRHRYSEKFLLDATFELERQVSALFGPSGSGKTSILEIIAGALRADDARVSVGSRVLCDTQAGVHVAAEKRCCGVVFQDQLLFPHLTVSANLRYGISRRRAQREIRVDKVVKVLELADVLNRFPTQLSGGERQRVALGRALLCGPELLMMDEPLAALDDALKFRILSYLERAIEEWQIPVLFVSHAQHEVRRLAQWVVVLQRGHVVAAGVPDEALARPQPLSWTDAAGPVNLLRIEKITTSDGVWLGHVGAQQLSLPISSDPERRPLYLQFVPASVTLSRHDVTGLSIRNHLMGTVRHIVGFSDRVFVAVDLGQIIWAEVTPAAASELELITGCSVTCLIKTRSLSVVA